MRLSGREIAAFCAVLGSRIQERGAELYLFGSRVYGRLKGGDIDLLLLASSEVVRRLRSEKHFVLAEFKRELGDQRIDLVLAEASDVRGNPFLRRALRTAILLKRWRSRPRPPGRPARTRLSSALSVPRTGLGQRQL